jgi:hypothetical protein
MQLISKQAEQAAEKWHWRASGVKTPDESNALTSWLKPRPTNLPTFSAACSACFFDFRLSHYAIQKQTG